MSAVFDLHFALGALAGFFIPAIASAFVATFR